MSLGWYLRRLMRMSAGEMVHRVRDAVLKRLWRRRQVTQAASDRLQVPESVPPFESKLGPVESLALPKRAREQLLAAADELLDGRWNILGEPTEGVGAQPDWFLDHRNAKHAPHATYAFAINHRDVERYGVPKHVWELSRHSQITLLASAYHASGDAKYAERASEQLESWWEQNPFLSGIHWTSGIEIGLRVLAWVWVRRLLDGWSGASALFEENRTFKQQLHHHLSYLDTFQSCGTSANNHLIAEVAGQFAACCAFPYFNETARWRQRSGATLARAIAQQTFASGLNREQATEYHGFVIELGLLAGLEGERAGHSLGEPYWTTVVGQLDALAALVDVCGNPPRQGDGDDACALLLDAPEFGRWQSILATGAALFGAREWWPRFEANDVRTKLLASLASIPKLSGTRPAKRPSFFADAGLGILRCSIEGDRELWCRCDGGPHGYDTVAGHAHADALSIELRIDGVDILADPGTYTYHGEPAWRRFFRSTRGHNTLEVAGEDQSVAGGEFFWTHHAESKVLESCDEPGGLLWRGSHNGYERMSVPATHVRTVRIDEDSSSLLVVDELASSQAQPCVLTFHLGPRVSCELAGAQAKLTWDEHSAFIELPDRFQWEAIRGQEDPPLGWYSPRFGEKAPTTCLIGTGLLDGSAALETRFWFGSRDESLPSPEGSSVT